MEKTFLSKLLKEIRTQCGKTQEQFAHMLGISLRNYIRYESGETEMRASVFLDAIEFIENPNVKDQKQYSYKDMQKAVRIYANSLNNEIDESRDYYYVNWGEDWIEGSTEWVGYTNTTPVKEIRRLCLVNPHTIIHISREENERVMIVHKPEEAIVFRFVKGRAIIAKELLKVYLSDIDVDFFE